MLSCFTKRPIYFNKNLSDYCTKIMNDSIRKLTEKYNLERNKPKVKNIFHDDDDNDEIPKFNLNIFLIFLSISTITIYFYKRLK